MRPVRVVVVVLAAVLFGALGACSSAQPCPNCPPLNGPWSMSWTDGTFRPDGCTDQGPRPATLNFVQEQSDLKTIVDGKELKGTILDTWDFNLNGGDTTITYSMRGKAISDGLDAGVHIEGTLTIQGACTFDEGYLGQKL